MSTYRGAMGDCLEDSFEAVNKVLNAVIQTMMILIQDCNCTQNVADVWSAVPWILAEYLVP